MPAPLHTSARALEFDSLRELLRGYASSPLGHRRIAALAPSTDFAWIEIQQQLATEIREFRRVGGRFDFSGLSEINSPLDKSRIAGAALETTEIRDILLVVDRAAEWREIALHPPATIRSEWRRVRSLSARIVDFTDFLRSFRNTINPDGTLEDKASPELARIRREIEKQRRTIQESLQSYLRRLSEGGAVQEELVTIRGERFVIPVKVEQKRRVHGVIHGASSSGQTVFVEPLETIEQNNELVRLLDEETAEIHRILIVMTSRIAALADSILAAVDVLAELELQFAKARFAEDYNCVEAFLCGAACGVGAPAARQLGLNVPGSREPNEAAPPLPRSLRQGGDFPAESPKLETVASSPGELFSPGGARDLARTLSPQTRDRDAARMPQGLERHLLLHRARHPLLERNLKSKGLPIVPVTIELESRDFAEDDMTRPGMPQVSPPLRDLGTTKPDHRQLIITGPNTGGKTVALKTVGLLALMAQAGLPVPADRAELPVFDAIFADIGDYQSIEQNLSTFSAHVTNIDFISRTATANSLVLLDELGSATDPEEGAALAVAIAAHFARIGSMTIISTHHTALKVYAANSPGVLNAAVGFDQKTLQPTYDLKVGVPGASAGINIAQRLGLNPSIIQSARSRLGSQARDVAQFLDKLHAELRDAESQRLKLQSGQKELEDEKKRLAAEGKNLQAAKIRELEKKLDTLLRDFEYHAREAVNAVQDRVAAQKLSKDAERRIAKLRREFRDQFDSTVVAHSTGADQGDPHAQPQLVKHVSEGDTVKLKSTGRSARIARKIDDTHFEVEMGPLKMKIARDDIAEVLASAARPVETPVKAARARGISVSLEDESASVPSEINVIGYTVDDASREVEKFLDRAFLAGLARVRVVHGSGMGILRKALRQMLERHPHVASIAEPPQNEGGAGATVVDLRT
ncbi:MAG TPA: Smr/MutS family protein [Verrucomicrobiae bacterium]|jgi:DNA mismatch repair protein MutS2|nr:Smr/MutS family protein [Verrucomicrobiae bacterium]